MYIGSVSETSQEETTFMSPDRLSTESGSSTDPNVRHMERGSLAMPKLELNNETRQPWTDSSGGTTENAAVVGLTPTSCSSYPLLVGRLPNPTSEESPDVIHPSPSSDLLTPPHDTFPNLPVHGSSPTVPQNLHSPSDARSPTATTSPTNASDCSNSPPWSGWDYLHNGLPTPTDGTVVSSPTDAMPKNQDPSNNTSHLVSGHGPVIVKHKDCNLNFAMQQHPK